MSLKNSTSTHSFFSSAQYGIAVGFLMIASMVCLKFLPTQKAILGMLFASFLMSVAIFDLKYLIIPNSLTLLGFIGALVLSIFFPILHTSAENFIFLPRIESFFCALTGAFIGSAALLWIAIFTEAILHKEPLGMGDIKLMGAIGAFCGWKGALFTIFGGSLLATILILPYLFFKKIFFKNTSTANLKIPFGFWLSLTAFLYFVWFQPIVENYLSSMIAIYSIQKIF